MYAELSSQDPDWKTHEKTIIEVLARNPYDESIIKAAANFYTIRSDWPGLENQMRDAAQRAPWLSTPHRVRGRAAERMRKNHAEIVAFYEQAVACAVSSNDDQTFSWYADYLFNNGAPRSQVDLTKAEDLLRRAIQLDPSDGRIMTDLGRVLIANGKATEGAKWLQTALNFLSSTQSRREVVARLAAEGIAVGEKEKTEADAGVGTALPTPEPIAAIDEPRTPVGTIPATPGTNSS